MTGALATCGVYRFHFGFIYPQDDQVHRRSCASRVCEVLVRATIFLSDHAISQRKYENTHNSMASGHRCRRWAITRQPDSCWSWLVCGASFCNMLITMGFGSSFGVLLPPIMDAFQETRAKTGKKSGSLLKMTSVRSSIASHEHL